MPVKYYHVMQVCKSLFGKQKSAENRWNQIRDQAKILHSYESCRLELIVAGPLIIVGRFIFVNIQFRGFC